jgi:hypothetical protein
MKKQIKRLKKQFRKVEFELRNKIWDLENPEWKFAVDELVTYWPEPMNTTEDLPRHFKALVLSHDYMDYTTKGKIYCSPQRWYSIRFKIGKIKQTKMVAEYYLSEYDE